LPTLCPNKPVFRSETIEYGWDAYTIRPFDAKSKGRADLGAFDPETATWRIRVITGSEVADRTIRFGQPGDIPLVGDWDGDAMDGIGVFHPATREWALDNDLDGRADVVVRWSAMRAGDRPIVGDWDGDGVATVGFFRPSDISWHLRNSNSDGSEDVPVFRFATPTDVPLAGDWDGDGIYTIGIYRPETGGVAIKNSHVGATVDQSFKVEPGRFPVVTSWKRHTPTAVSTFANGTWTIHYVACNCASNGPLAPTQRTFGQDGDIPITGDWHEP